MKVDLFTYLRYAVQALSYHYPQGKTGNHGGLPLQTHL